MKVQYISALLEAGNPDAAMPQRLNANSGIAYQGCVIVGTGFVLSTEERFAWIAADPSLAKVVRPFLTGDDISSRPDLSPSRAVIDFNDMSEQAARAYKEPFARVEELVRPERMKVNRKAHRERWWQFGDKRPGLRAAIAGLDEVLVIARTSSNVMPVRVKTDCVFGDSLNVFATASYCDQAALSSAVHQLWAVTYGGTLETRIRYVPTDVFETFPLPEASLALEAIGRLLNDERSRVMKHRNLTLTQLYNLVNAPQIPIGSDVDVCRIRDLHVELDEAVVQAFGWTDLNLHHGFHTYRNMERWTVDPAARVEILDRLLKLNHIRAAAQGPAIQTKGKRKAAAKVDAEGLF